MKKEKAFTLIELLVVISVIGLLASIVLVNLNSTRARARDAKRLEDLRQIATALELFYEEYDRYPIVRGHSYWDGQWMYLQTCLETGSECGFAISGYKPVMSDVPQDPLDSDPNAASIDGITYYFSWGGCSNQSYILRVQLETNNPALNTDADGSYYSSLPLGCEDAPDRWYCMKKDWCY